MTLDNGTNLENEINVEQFTEDDVEIIVSEPQPLPEKVLLDNCLILVNGALDDCIIQPNSCKTFKIDLETPKGYRVMAFRQVAIEKATNNGVGEEKCILRHFSTADKETKANVSIYNLGEEQATIKLHVVAMAKVV